MSMYMCLNEYMYTCMCECPQRLEEGVGYLGSGVKDIWKLFNMCAGI